MKPSLLVTMRRRGPSPPGAFWRCRSAPGKMRIKPVALIALRVVGLFSHHGGGQ
jgi:hypothetical protein